MIRPQEIKEVEKDTPKFSRDVQRALQELEAEVRQLKQRIQKLESKG